MNIRFLSLLLLAGCSLTDLAGEPPQLYQLQPPAKEALLTPSATTRVLPDQVLIDVPMASAGIDTPRMALTQADGTLGYFRNVSWTDRVPVLYQTLLVDTFDRTGLIPAVGRENVGLRADYLLKVDLNEFQADYRAGKPPVARISVRAKLIVMPRRIIVATEAFSKDIQAEGEGMAQISAAFQKASDAVLTDLSGWTYHELEGREPHTWATRSLESTRVDSAR